MARTVLPDAVVIIPFLAIVAKALEAEIAQTEARLHLLLSDEGGAPPSEL